MSISISYRSAALALEAYEAASTAASHSILAACAAGASADVMSGASAAVDRLNELVAEARAVLKATPMFEPEDPAPATPEPEEALEAPEAPEPERVIVWQHPLAARLQVAEAVEHDARRLVEDLHDAGADEAEIADAEQGLYESQCIVDHLRARLEAEGAEPDFGTPAA